MPSVYHRIEPIWYTIEVSRQNPRAALTAGAWHKKGWFLMQQEYTRVIVICRKCGKEMSLVPSTAAVKKYCSHECFYTRNITGSEEDWFWSQVNKTETCWNWKGKVFPEGYGAFTPRIDHDRKCLIASAHRYSFYKANGEIPKGMVICHKCDNRLCVRPDHLFLGTHQENALDMLRKGRSKNTHFTETDIIEIRRKYASGQHGYVSLGREYKVNQATIHAIVNRRAWSHVP